MIRTLFQIALRNLLVHRTATLIVAFIIGFGAFLVVLGTAILDSVNRSMEQSITQSFAGHLQIYSAEGKDDLALFGTFISGEDFGVLAEFGKVREAIEATPNVKAAIPMGLKTATIIRGNDLDVTLEALRDAVRAGDSVQRAYLSDKVRNVARDLVDDLKLRLAIAGDPKSVEVGLADLEVVLRADFWDQRLAADSEDALTFLDTRIAPLAEDGKLFYLRTLGTDVHRFVQHFDRFEIVDGAMFPPGERGVLLAKQYYEEHIKHRVARKFDLIRKQRSRGRTIADDPELRDEASRLPRQYRRILHQLQPQDAQDLEAHLRHLLAGANGDLKALLESFLTLDDANFDVRYAFFYEHIAPKIELYAFKVGAAVTLRTVTKSGYIKALKVPVRGTYQFKSLEESELAGAQNLIDLVSFRELYGVMTDAKKRELADIRERVGTREVERANAEAALFGDASALVEEGAAAGFEAKVERVVNDDVRAYTQEDIDSGLAISAAVLLKDPSQLVATRAALGAVADTHKLKIKDWKEAAGIVGQFIVVLQIVLFVTILITFFVALIIINNAMVTATLERTPEIGTMRAMGAGRRLVMFMFLIETSALGLIAGGTGALLAAALVRWVLGVVGIPAPVDELIFLFSGPRLYPTVGVFHVGLGFAVVLLVSIVATLYPAFIAARIRPVVAMEASE